ncbi:hypothetical protein MLGJGCBP_05398 [Rhodococcus sp. T7]|nr:hypothetical protein MLGJGCBP_09661 [Rhodococcus sp. T7]KAF0961518.1 hypothetical protein MLGJGCBP_05398 [Rhodococcus sp. T7]
MIHDECDCMQVMTKRHDAVYVVRARKSHVDYESADLRRTFREVARVRNETVANLSTPPAHVIDWFEAGLK